MMTPDEIDDLLLSLRLITRRTWLNRRVWRYALSH